MFAQAELLKKKKTGRFSYESAKIKFAQAHSGGGVRRPEVLATDTKEIELEGRLL